MATLLLRIAAPLQSWGISSKFETRGTIKEPSKSGIIGMILAALGTNRIDSDKVLEKFSKIRFGIRVDQEGKLAYDYQIVQAVGKNSKITYRYYLSDAIFLVGLESEDLQFLEKIDYALKHPKFPLFLGRRSCPPTFPLVLDIKDMDLLSVLKEYPSLVPEWRKKENEICRIIYDDPEKEDRLSRQQDVPLSFSPLHREYGYRLVSEEMISLSHGEHDPMRELR